MNTIQNHTGAKIQTGPITGNIVTIADGDANVHINNSSSNFQHYQKQIICGGIPTKMEDAKALDHKIREVESQVDQIDIPHAQREFAKRVIRFIRKQLIGKHIASEKRLVRALRWLCRLSPQVAMGILALLADPLAQQILQAAGPLAQQFYQQLSARLTAR